MFITTLAQDKIVRPNTSWGWLEEDLKPHHRLSNDDRFMDGGSGPRAARPVFDSQPAVYSR